jgi:hypothetical protein
VHRVSRRKPRRVEALFLRLLLSMLLLLLLVVMSVRVVLLLPSATTLTQLRKLVVELLQVLHVLLRVERPRGRRGITQGCAAAAASSTASTGCRSVRPPRRRGSVRRRSREPGVRGGRPRVPLLVLLGHVFSAIVIRAAFTDLDRSRRIRLPCQLFRSSAHEHRVCVGVVHGRDGLCHGALQPQIDSWSPTFARFPSFSLLFLPLSALLASCSLELCLSGHFLFSLDRIARFSPSSLLSLSFSFVLLFLSLPRNDQLICVKRPSSQPSFLLSFSLSVSFFLSFFWRLL